jgi:nucleotide-binding universal stress UspA family protein
MMGSSVNMVGVYFNEKQLEENLQKRITYVTEEINNRLKIFINEKVADNPESGDKVASIEVCQGYPADEILKKVDDLHCDLIVMGTHGKGLVGQAFFGSVAKRVLRRVRKPVFIIPLPEE